MTKETRANLLFLTVFLAISLPGGVALFKKKLDPAIPPSYMPDTRRQSLTYIAPMDAPDLRRYVPDELGKWVAELARQHGDGSVLSRGNMPVTSAQRRWQLIGVRPSGNGVAADLILWDATTPANAALEVRCVQGGRTIDGRVDSRQVVAIPEPIRKELIYGGYPKPPKEATWVSVIFEGLTDRKPGDVIQLREKGGAGERADSVTLFTN